MNKTQQPLIVAASLTPLEASGQIDYTRLIKISHWQLTHGCDALALFGTTGEGPSFSVAEKIKTLENMTVLGAQKLIIGTGTCVFSDAVEIAHAAASAGCAGTLVIPPYFFKPVQDEGLYQFYSKLIERVNHDALRIYLYNFPEMTGFNFPLKVVSRLHQEYPMIVTAIKDSSGNLSNMQGMLAENPNLKVLTGDDHLLYPLLNSGGTGAITAGANIWCSLLNSLQTAYERDQSGIDLIQTKIEKLWTGCLLKFPVAEALKYLFATHTGNPDWELMRPPLIPLNSKQRHDLDEALNLVGFEFEPSLIWAVK